MQVRQRIAVVEDDREFREAILLPMLIDAGFDVVGMPTALALYRALITDRFDAVLLDVDLPDEDGFAIARNLRAHPDAPQLVMLTGGGSDEARRQGQEAGAAAFLIKPVDRATLVGTLETVLQQNPTGGHWALDGRGWRLHAPDGTTITLSLQEHQVMRLLAATPGAPVRREALIARLTDDVQGFDPHRLEMVIYRLRRKCEDAAGQALPLRSVRGLGYVLTW